VTATQPWTLAAATTCKNRYTMNFNVEFKNFESDDKTRKLIQRLTRKLDKKLTGLSGDEVFLRLLIEENAARRLFRASLTLTFPEKTLAAM
jgi:hypothetical protein